MSDELVLGVPLARLEQLGRFTGLTTDVPRYLPALLESAHLSFRPRAECETDPMWLQLIPYVVLEHEGRVFHYTRGNKGGEQRLHALKSIGIGGHINPVDNAAADPYRAGLERELHEEIAMPPPVRERVLGLVYDPSTPVGQVHLGVVHVLTLPIPEAMPRDPGLTECGFTMLGDLLTTISAFETWSQFALRALAA